MVSVPSLQQTIYRHRRFLIVDPRIWKCKPLLTAHVLAAVADVMAWTVRNDVIWHKTSPPPESPRNRWRSGHEHILFLSKRRSGYRFNTDAIRVPHSSATIRRWGAGQSYGGPKSKGRRSPKDSRMRDGQTFRLNPFGCVPTDVWSYAGANTSAGHYAAFPQQLVRTIVEACSLPGDLVLDPFAGSGTTCAVAASLGRRSLGIDLNPEYAVLAEEAACRSRAA